MITILAKTKGLSAKSQQLVEKYIVEQFINLTVLCYEFDEIQTKAAGCKVQELATGVL